jgi:protein-tyrosine phosphatase
MTSVLFVCRANQFRSPIAAACLKQILERECPEEEWVVESAGTWTKDGLSVPPNTLQIGRSLGLTGLERHATHQVHQALLDRFDLVLVMENSQKEALRFEFPSASGHIFLLSELVDGIDYDIPDPSSSIVDMQNIGSEICRLVTNGSAKIVALSQALHRER